MSSLKLTYNGKVKEYCRIQVFGRVFPTLFGEGEALVEELPQILLANHVWRHVFSARAELLLF